MKSKLLVGLDQDAEKLFKENFIKSQGFRKHMVKVIDREIEELRFSMRDERNFNSINWPYIQADRLAQEKAFIRMKNWINEK